MEETLAFVRNASPRDHICYFYSDLEEKYRVLSAYFSAGLEKGEALLLLTDDERPDEALKSLKEFGLDVEKQRRRNALGVLASEEFYLKNGVFDLSKPFKELISVVSKARGRGYKGLRIMGDMNSLFADHINQLLEYEELTGKTLKGPMIGMCNYNIALVRRRNQGRYLLEILRLHSNVVAPKFAGDMDFPSLYLETVEEQLKASFGESAKEGILYRAEHNHDFPRQLIANQPLRLLEVLDETLGLRAQPIQDRILGNFYRRLGYDAAST